MAGVARATWDIRVDRDAVTKRKACNRWTQFHDRSGKLMPDYHAWTCQGILASGNMDISAAKP
jgi:hypothetical protein